MADGEGRSPAAALATNSSRAPVCQDLPLRDLRPPRPLTPSPINMAKGSSEMLEFDTKNKAKRSVNAVLRVDRAMMRLEAAERLRSIAGDPVNPVKAAIGRAAAFVSRFLAEPMTDGRAEDIWRLAARRIDAEEMEAIRLADAERQRLKEAQQLGFVRDTLLAAAERLREEDEARHRASIARYERVAGEIGAAGLPVAGED